MLGQAGLLRIRIFHAVSRECVPAIWQASKLPRAWLENIEKAATWIVGVVKSDDKMDGRKGESGDRNCRPPLSHQLLHLGMPMKWNKVTKEIKHLYITSIEYLSISSQHEIVKLKAALITSFAAKTSRLRIQTSPFFSAAPQTKIIRTTMLKPVTPTSPVQEGSWSSSYTLGFEGSAIYFCPT